VLFDIVLRDHSKPDPIRLHAAMEALVEAFAQARSIIASAARRRSATAA